MSAGSMSSPRRTPFPTWRAFISLRAAAGPSIRATLRLATSQKVAAVAALSSGGYVMADADVVVTLSACIDGG